MRQIEREYIKQKIKEGYGNIEVAMMASAEFKRGFSPADVASIKYREVKREDIRKPEELMKRYHSPELPEDDYLICSDIHAPFYSQEWVDRYFAVAKKFEIEKQIIVGDLFEFSAISSFPPMTDNGNELSFSAELDTCRELISRMNKVFKKSFLVSGNHERRIYRAFESAIPFSMILRYFPEMEKNFIFTPYDKVAVGNDWLLLHPVSYSQISGNVAFRLAAKFRKNILNAHGHFFCLRYDASGKNLVIELGGLFDVEKIDYINLKSTTHPFWNPGFCMLRKGKIHLFHQFTDWEFYLGKERKK